MRSSLLGLVLLALLAVLLGVPGSISNPQRTARYCAVPEGKDYVFVPCAFIRRETHT